MMAEATCGFVSEPGEGERLRAVKSAVNSAVSRVLAGWKVSLLAACFPSYAKDNIAGIDALSVYVVEAVQKALYEDFATIIEDDVSKPLEDLCMILKNYSGPKGVTAWRPTGDPESHMMAHDAKVLRYEKQRLLDLLGSMRSSSSRLLEKVKEGRKECQENHVKIQGHLSAMTELLETSGTIHQNNISELYSEETNYHPS